MTYFGLFYSLLEIFIKYVLEEIFLLQQEFLEEKGKITYELFDGFLGNFVIEKSINSHACSNQS